MANSHSLDLELSSSQFAYVADNVPLSITGDFTLEAWVKLEQLASTVGDAMAVVGKFYHTTNKRSYLLYISSANKLGASVSSDGGANTSFTETTSALITTVGQWYHIAVAYTASTSTFDFYLNGIFIQSVDAIYTSINNNDSRFAIGAASTDGGSPIWKLDGLIDDVRVWSDVRTATEIHDNIFADVTAETGLVGYWKLDNDYLDATANNNDLTSSGSPVFSTTVPFPTYRTLNPVILGSMTLGSDANLKAYYKLEDALDETANNYDLTNTGSVAFNAAKFSNGADFGTTNTTKRLSTTNQLGIDGGAISIAGWVKIGTDITTGSVVLFAQGNQTSKVYYQLVYEYNSGNPRLVFYRTRAGVVDNTIAFVITLGTSIYHHVALTYDGTTVRAYVNGIFVGSVASSGNGTDSTGRGDGFALAQNVAGSSTLYANGIFDDFAVFNDALTAAEIFDLYTGIASSPSASVSPSVSVSASPSITPSVSVSLSPSITPSVSVSLSPSVSASVSVSSSPSSSQSPSSSVSLSISPTPSISVSLSPSPSPSISVSLSPSVSVSASPSLSPSLSGSPSLSVSLSISPTPSVSISLSPSITPSSSVSLSPSVSASITPSISVSLSPSLSPSLSGSPSVSVSLSISPTPSVSVSASPSVSLSLSISPTPSVSESPSPSISVSLSPSVSQSISESVSESASPSVSPSATGSFSISPSPSLSASLTPSVSVSLSISPSPSVSISLSPSASVSPSPSPAIYVDKYEDQGTLYVDKYEDKGTTYIDKYQTW